MRNQGCSYLIVIVLVLLAIFFLFYIFSSQVTPNNVIPTNNELGGSEPSYCHMCMENCLDMGKSHEECQEQCKEECS